MSGKTNIDRKNERHQATRAEIVGAAWALAREHGLTGFSMRQLGDRIGMRAQSIYTYFDSQHDIYDAMFHDGYRAVADGLDRLLATHDPGDPVSTIRAMAHEFVRFCADDPVRHQLLFQRVVPGFEPAAESYAVALSVLARTGDVLAALGFDDDALDLWTAVTTGLASQQVANDPGGDRWLRLVDRAVSMLLTDVEAAATRSPSKGTS